MDYLERQLSKDRILRFIAIPWTVFLAAGGVGLFAIQDQTIRVVVFTILGVFAAAWLVLLTLLIEGIRRKSSRESSAALVILDGRYRQVTDRANLYAHALAEAQRRDPERFSIDLWEDKMVVQSNGDTVIVRDMILLAGDRPLDLVSSITRANVPAVPESVGFEAFWLEQNGDEGVPIHWTSSWTDDNKEMTVFLHYKDSIKPQAVLRVRLRWTWPEYSKKLVDGGNEEMTYTFIRNCRKLRYELTFVRDCKVKNVLRIRPFDGTPQMLRQSQSDGSVKYEFEINDLAPNTTAGFEAGSAVGLQG